MPRPAISTQARLFLQRALAPLGLEVVTTRAQRAEAARLQHLRARGHWQHPRYTAGLSFELEMYRAFLQTVWLPYARDFEASLGGKAERGGYYPENVWFGPVDAQILYGVIRHYRPARIVEIGSGYSTMLARQAIGDGRLDTRLLCIDPSPRASVVGFADEHIAARVEDIDPTHLLSQLRAGDILFIDSSHNVVVGGDCPMLYLEILPHLPDGVLVHIHDIFIPFDYPDTWVINHGRHWNEQYLLHAFLIGNNNYEILWPSHYVDKSAPKLLKEFCIDNVTSYAPSSLWIQKRLSSRPPGTPT